MSEKKKPYLGSIRKKHPTIAADSVAYASGGKKTFTDNYNDYIKSVETIDLAIRTIANIMSLAKMELWKKVGNKLKPATVKNIDLEFPNETDSSVDFLRKLGVSIFSQGAGLIITEEKKRGKASGKMVNFYTTDVARVEAESDGRSLITQFKYISEGGEDLFFKAADVVYVNDSIDPSNLLYSLSRLRALNDVILMQAGIVAQSKEMLSGGAKKAAVISSDAPISKRNMDKIKTEFNAFMSSAASSVMFMNTPLNVTQIGNSMTGTEMLNLLSQVNGMMLEAFAIPPYLLGRYGSGANRSTEITYAIRVFFNMQIKPVMKNIEMQMTKFLRNSLGLSNVSMKFNYDDLDILHLPYEELVDVALKQLKAGAISVNEARDMMELPPVDQGTDLPAADRVFMPAYLLGAAPVSYNDYDSDLERLLNISSAGAGEEDLPAGNAGGEDNENVESGSTGGNDDEE